MNARRVLLIAYLTIVGIAIYVVGDRGESTREIVNASPCIEAPASKACSDARRDILRNENPAVTCIAFRNVGYPCPAPEPSNRRSGTSGQEPAESPSESLTEPQGGGEPSTPAASSQPPPPNGGGNNGTPHSPPENPALLDPVTDLVCSVNALGVRICL